MLNCLKNLYRKLKNRFFPEPEAPQIQPPPDLSDLEYENLLMELIEEAKQGSSWGNIQAIFIIRKVNKAFFVRWLKGFGERCQQQPELHQQLTRDLRVLARVASGDVGTALKTIALGLGNSLSDSRGETIALGLGNSLSDSGGETIALGLGNSDSEEASKQAEAYLEQGNNLYNLGRIEEAIASYDKVLQFKPDYHEAWYRRGVALGNLGRNEEAIASYDQALQFKPDYHQAWINRGVALDNLGRYEEAIASCDQALQIKPDFHPAWNNRGFALMNLGRNEEAIAYYDQALQIKPDFHEAWTNRGNALGNLGRYEEAIAYCDQALQFKPDLHPAWSNRGIALYKLGRYEEAIASYDQALQFKPDDHYAWNNRGYALYNLGRYEEAIASYDQVLQFKPDFHQAWHNRGVAAGSSRNRPFPQPRTILTIAPPVNPQLNLRGYEGEIASYEAELGKAIGRETHPEGWAKLHQAAGKAHYLQGRNAPYPRSFWRKAEASYKKALLSLNVPQWDELRLEILQNLITVLINLKEIQAAQHLRQEGTSLLKRMLADNQRSDAQKRQLSQKTALFNQLTVDITLQTGTVTEALILAETGKNICLRWLLGIDEVPALNYAQFQQFLKPNTAIIYWHLSPSALTTFLILPNSDVPILINCPLIDEQREHIFENSQVNSPPINEISEDKHSAQLLQVLVWEKWLKNWQKNYEDYGDKSTSRDNFSKKSHPWRLQMEASLNKLRTILNLAEIETYLNNFSIENLLLIPHRNLHLFPLHYCFPGFICSYLPSVYTGLIRFDSPQALFESVYPPQPPFERGELEELGELAKKDLLLVENPQSTPDNHKSLGDLYFAEVEAELIYQRLIKVENNLTFVSEVEDNLTFVSDTNITRIPNKEATYKEIENALKQPHRIFHFTGHGAYNSENPLESCLFLSGTDKLTLENIVQLDLSAYEIIILAACETAVTGNHTITDEYIGLNSGFLKAGVNYIISTLWTVESFASTLLMVEFYQQLQTVKSPIYALNNAQNWLKNAHREDIIQWLDKAREQLPESNSARDILNDQKFLIAKMPEIPYNHPYYWAAFTIFGSFS